MENMLTIIGAVLSFTAACMGVIDKYGWRKGWFISAVVLAVVVLLSIVLKIFTKEDAKWFVTQKIGNKALAKGDMVFKDIKQEACDHQPNVEQSIGEDVKAGKNMSFEKIRQGKK